MLRFGLAVMNDFPPGTVPAHRVREMREQVRAASEAGFHSVWMLQHYLGNMPTLQPLPTLAAMAEDAGEMHLGTNMYILPLRHPIGVAEEFSTLDHLTGGRAIAGLGMGYRENEFASFGVPMDERVARFEESIDIVRGLWGGGPLTYAGRHFALEEQSISLPPVQAGGPPIWIGAGAHRTGALRAARLGDAWIVPPHTAPDRLARVTEAYAEERARLGRGRSELVVRRELVLDRNRAAAAAAGVRARNALSNQYAAFNAPDQAGNYDHLKGDAEATRTAERAYLFTDPAGAVERLHALEAQGITYVVLRMQWFDLEHAVVMRTMELFAEHVAGEFH